MKWRRIRLWLASVFVVLIMAFVGVVWFVGGFLVAPAQRAVGPPPADLPVESVKLISESGATLAAWFIPSENATATVILLHPVSSNRSAMLGRARLLRDAGYSTFLVDLQAHGESSGAQITAGYRERHDVAAAVKFIRTRNPEQEIGIVGCSLGGAATLLATPLEIDALVLESVYPTISEAVHNRIAMRLGPMHYVLAPALLVQLELRLGISPSQLQPIEHIAHVGCPILISVGECDRHTTLVESNRLYNAASEPKRLVVFSDAAHSDLLIHDPVRYRDEVIGFLNTHLRLAPLDDQPKK